MVLKRILKLEIDMAKINPEIDPIINPEIISPEVMRACLTKKWLDFCKLETIWEGGGSIYSGIEKSLVENCQRDKIIIRNIKE